MNYQRELDQLLARLEEEKKVPRLLLHSCCAPCSSYVLEYLSAYFAITVFYYNPNIYPESEYTKRILEQQTLIGEMKTKHPVSFVAGVYEKEKFYEMAAGLEHVREGGERCMRCYELRLREAARLAEEGGYPSDFKKKNGYKRSIELSRIYGLYRQDYCGCEFSLRDAQARRKDPEKQEN